MIKILFVDDDENLYLIYRELLKQNIHTSFSLIHASTVQNMKNYLQNNRYDIVILDQKLDNGNKGTEYIETIKKHNIYSYIIVNSAYSSESLAIEAIRKGADDYVPGNKENNDEFIASIQKAIKEVSSLKDITSFIGNIKEFNRNKDNEIFQEIDDLKKRYNIN